MQQRILWKTLQALYVAAIIISIMVAFYHTVVLQQFDMVEIYETEEE